MPPLQGIICRQSVSTWRSDSSAAHPQAVGDTCEYIGKCSQPVCNQDTMYNNTKVEALCGMCVLAGQVWRRKLVSKLPSA